MNFSRLVRKLRGSNVGSSGRKLRRHPNLNESFLHLEGGDENGEQSYEMTHHREAYLFPGASKPSITVTDWNDRRKDEVWDCTFDYLSVYPPQLVNPGSRPVSHALAQWRQLQNALSRVALELKSWHTDIENGTSYRPGVRRFPSAHPASSLPTDQELDVLIGRILWFRGVADAIHRWDAHLLAPHILPSLMNRLQTGGPDRETDRILRLAGERLLHVAIFVDRFTWFADHRWPPSTCRRPSLASAFGEAKRIGTIATAPFQEQLWAIRGMNRLP